LSLVIGMVSVACILGVHAKRTVVGQQSDVVKGLAEKSIKADDAEWTIHFLVASQTQAEALVDVAQTSKLLFIFYLLVVPTIATAITAVFMINRSLIKQHVLL